MEAVKQKGDKEFVLEAVKQKQPALQHAAAELKGDKEFVLEAVKQKGCALECNGMHCIAMHCSCNAVQLQLQCIAV